MGLFNIIKKKEVPTKLPSLAINEPTFNQVNSNPISNSITKPIQPTPNQNPQKSYKPLPIHQSSKTTQKSSEVVSEDEKGFFRDLMQELTADLNKSKLDGFNKNQFLTEDIVHQMRSYWEKQKPELLLRNVGSDLKNKLKDKTESLGHLEKEWQEIYFSLLSKEDKIREEEKELKNLIAELTELYQSSMINKKSDK